MPRKIENATELAAYLVGMTEAQEQYEVEDALIEKYEIDMDHFEALANDLLRMTPTLPSPLDGSRQLHAFGHPDNGAWHALMRTLADG